MGYENFLIRKLLPNLIEVTGKLYLYSRAGSSYGLMQIKQSCIYLLTQSDKIAAKHAIEVKTDCLAVMANRAHLHQRDVFLITPSVSICALQGHC